MSVPPGQLSDIAVLGTGAMGGGMARRLLATGHRVRVYNRTAAKAEPLVAAGASAAVTAADAATGADVVLLSLSDDDAVEHVLFTGLDGVLRPGQYLLDTSTVSPVYSRRATGRLAEAGVCRLEACVIGNPFQAVSGELRILTGGPADAIEAVRPLLTHLGKDLVHLGPAGAASTAKLVFNILLGAQLASLAEAVSLGVAAGLDRDLLVSAIAGSGFSSRVMAFRAEFVRRRAYEPAAFRSRLMNKDLRLALGEAAGYGVSMPVTQAVEDLFRQVVDSGRGDSDAAVVVESRLGDRPFHNDTTT